MSVRILAGLAALWGAGIVFFKFIGDGDHLLGEPITRADLVILMIGWVLLGVGLYFLLRRKKESI